MFGFDGIRESDWDSNLELSITIICVDRMVLFSIFDQ